MSALPYLAGYSPELQQRVQALLDAGQLGDWLAKRYPDDSHAIQTDRALYDYVEALRQRYLRNSSPLSKVLYDNRLDPVQHTLGTNTFVARVQGGKLKSKNEIRVASLFRDAPEPFLRMLVVHELAHLKEKEHNKAFYQLCCHMEPDYHQHEFDLRVWLTWRRQGG